MGLRTQGVGLIQWQQQGLHVGRLRPNQGATRLRKDPPAGAGERRGRGSAEAAIGAQNEHGAVG
jgi:hypothetical protein